MKKRKARGIIFDLDGTLLDSLQGIAKAANQVLEEAGYPAIPVKKYRHFVGWGLRELIRQILPESSDDPDIIRRYASRYRLFYAHTWRTGTRYYPDIPDLLTWLANRDITMSVLSNKTQRFTQLMVREMLEGFPFKTVRGSVDGSPAKPHPEAARQVLECMGTAAECTLMVGDTAIDMETAVRAGMIPIGVRWGFHSSETLRDTGAVKIIKNPMDILDLCRATE